MKKRVVLALGVAVLACETLQAAGDIQSMFTDGNVSGQIRSFSIARGMEFSSPAISDYTRRANAIGGFLKYETAPLEGFSLGTAFYTTNGFALGTPQTDNTKVDPTVLGKDNESYSILGEAYIQYKLQNTVVTAGRQKLNTPLAGADDGRMLPNLFQAYTLTNKDIKDTSIFLSHATHFAQGTFGRIYSSESGNLRDKILASTAAYSAVNDRSQVGEFVNIGTYALGTKTDGLSIASATYSGIKNLKLQAWDYYAHDIMNSVYLQGDYKWDCLLSQKIKPFVAVQYIKENDVGDKLLKTIDLTKGDGSLDSDYIALKLGANIDNFSSYLAYSQVSENSMTDPVYAHATMTMWGGMPAFIQGMLTRLAGTKASKVQMAYNWKDFGANVETSASYAKLDMGQNNGWTEGDASEYDFMLTYLPAAVKNLEVRVRANYSNDFLVNPVVGSLSWDEYHLILKYNF